MSDVYFDGKVIGRIEGDTFITTRRPEHFFKKYAGFGISEKVLSQLESNHVNKIEIIYYGVKGIRKYETTVIAYRKSPNVHIDKENDKQKFVPIIYTRETKEIV